MKAFLLFLTVLFIPGLCFSQSDLFKGLSPGVDRQTFRAQVMRAGHTITSGYDIHYGTATLSDSTLKYLFVRPKDASVGCITERGKQYCYDHGKFLVEFSNDQIEKFSCASPDYSPADSVTLRRYAGALIAMLQGMYGKPTLRKGDVRKLNLAPLFREMKKGVDLLYWIFPERDLKIRVYLMSSKIEPGEIKVNAWVSFICVSCEKEEGERGE
jgi:hypothetical protein